MTVVECFTASKTGIEEHCEDLVMVTEDFAMIADGVTAKDGKSHKTPPGRMAAQIVANTIQQIPASYNAYDAVEAVTRAIASARDTNGLALTCCMVVYSCSRREIWSVGDCQFLVAGELHRPKHAVDGLLGCLRSFVLEAALSGGASIPSLMENDPGRNAILPFLQMQTQFANKAEPSHFAYGVINGGRVPSHLIDICSIPANVEEIVLASDGYPELRETLAESEMALAKLLTMDPLCYRELQSTKGLVSGAQSFDDRAFLRIKID